MRKVLGISLFLCSFWNVAQALPRSSPIARVKHGQAVLSDGRVLVTGGESIDRLYEHGSGAAIALLRSTAVFDPRTGAWAPAGDLVQARTRHSTIALPDGRAVVLGGGFQTLDPDPGVEVWDGHGRWRRAGRLLQARFGHTATLLGDGRVLVAGGSRDDLGGAVPGGNVLASVEIWDPATGTSRAAAPMPIALTRHAAIRLRDGRVLVTGGTTWWGGAPPAGAPGSARAFVYDPARDRWSEVGRMSGAREGHAVTLLADGGVLVVGNRADTALTACAPDDAACLAAPMSGDVADRFDPRTGRFTPTASMRFPRFGEHQAVTLRDGRVAVFGVLAGGCIPDAPQVVEVWDPATGAWSDMGDAPVAGEEGGRASVMPDGRVLLAGADMRPNRRGLVRAVASFEVWDPAAARPRTPPRVSDLPRAVME